MKRRSIVRRKDVMTLAVEDQPPLLRILSRISVEDRGYDTPCWIWHGAQNGRGYGKICLRESGSASFFLTHRLAWEALNGKVIPPGLQADHTCRQKLCIRHIE